MWSIKRLRRSWKKLQDLRRERDGVAAVEFGLVALPFFYLLIGILETGYIFFISIMLEDAAAEGARQIRTGEVQMSGTPATELGNAVCNNVFIVVVPCSDIIYEVSSAANFQSITSSAIPADQASASFATGNPGDVMVVRVTYSWTYITPLLENLLGAGARHLVSSVAFRNEPYPP